MRHSPNAVLMSGQRLRRWPDIKPTLEKCTIFVGKSPAQLTQNICITFIPALYKVIQMFYVYWVSIQAWGQRFEILAVIQSVFLQTKAQLRAIAKGFEFWWNC